MNRDTCAVELHRTQSVTDYKTVPDLSLYCVLVTVSPNSLLGSEIVQVDVNGED